MLASSSRHALKRSQPQLKTLLSSPVAVSVPIFHRNQRNASLSSKSGVPRDNNLHHDLWAFTPATNFQGTTISRAGPLGRYNFHISGLASRGKLAEALKLCSKMKAEGVKPDILTYNSLITACKRESLCAEAWAIYEDMLALGIHPDRDTFHRLIQVHQRQPASVSLDIWERMLGMGITPNVNSYDIIIRRVTQEKNLELALALLTDMEARGLSPTSETAEYMIVLAARLGHPRLAIDLATSYETGSVRPLSNTAWVGCLAASAEYLYAEGVEFCWNKVIHDLRVTPDEGLCIDVLHTAGRHGLPTLATDVIRALNELKVPLQEHHFSPLVEAFCGARMIKDAFSTLSVMTAADAVPIPDTTFPIFQAIQKNIDTLDEACTAVEEMRDAGQAVHVTALNCIIKAAVKQGDLQRAVGAYGSFSTFNAKPNADTFNQLLDGCIAASARELGDKLLLEMKDAAVKPDLHTYEKLIILCLTQSTYEDAFFYLEEMKSLSMVPTLAIYEALVRKCVTMGDTRHRLAVEEMVQCGHNVSKPLQTFIDSGGQVDVKEGKDDSHYVPSQGYGKVVNYHKRSKFAQ